METAMVMETAMAVVLEMEPAQVLVKAKTLEMAAEGSISMQEEINQEELTAL